MDASENPSRLSTSCGSENDDENMVFRWLLDAFSSVKSLEEIASAYCKSRGDLETTVEILTGLQLGGDVSHDSVGESSGAKSEPLLHVSNANNKLSNAPMRSRGSKPKKVSVSMGMVSGVMGKGYVKPVNFQQQSCKVSDPLKLKEEKLTTTMLRQEDIVYDSGPRNEYVNNKDIEEFLFSILGDGFQLDMDMIRDVLGQCGYDAKKGMEKLLGLSATTLNKDIDELCDTSTNKHLADKSPASQSSFEESSQAGYSAQRDNGRVVCQSGMESPNTDSERHSLSKELLETLFKVPERPEQAPKKTVPMQVVSKKNLFRENVVESAEPSTVIAEVQQEPEAVKEDEYQAFRTAARQHWDAMKAYYETALDAFTKGDRGRASYLLEQGNFYKEKAREVDEKSAQMIFETRDTDLQNKVTLELHDCHTKDAIRALKFHIRSLAFIPSIEFLRVIMETNTKGVTKGIRKRSVIKLLEKESIKWTEEGNPGTILIQINEIDPEKLSFAKHGSDGDD